MGAGGIELQRVLESYDRRFVTSDFIVCVSVQVSFVVQPLGQDLVHLAEFVAAGAVGVVGQVFIDRHDSLRGHRLVAGGARCQVEVTQGENSFGIFEENAASEFAAEIVEGLELAESGHEGDTVLLHRSGVVRCGRFEQHRGFRPLLVLVMFQSGLVHVVGPTAFQNLLYAIAARSEDRKAHCAQDI